MQRLYVIIRKSEDLAAQVRYIADNPCRRGIVTNWEDYAWTGAIGCDLKDVLARLLL